MRQVHRAGEKVFVDFSGKRPVIVDARTGEVISVDLFVGVLGASSYVYAEACPAQDLPAWITAHVRAVGGERAVGFQHRVLQVGCGWPCALRRLENQTSGEGQVHEALPS
jgi:hypothetical protein